MRRFAAVCSALFATVSACGDDGGSGALPDAPTAPDATPPPDTAPANTDVNIVATARAFEFLFSSVQQPVAPGTPVAGVLVFATKTDGTVVGTATTDAAGKATLTGLTAGVSVTALYPALDGNRELVTYAGVKPGDTLRLGDSYYRPVAAGAEGSVTVTFPDAPGASYYHLYSPCTSYGSYVSTNELGVETAISLSADCQTATAPILLLAYDSGYHVIASISLPAAPYTPGSILALTANQWVTNPNNNYTATLTSVSADTSYVNVGVDMTYGGFTAFDGSNAFEPGQTSATVTVGVPAATTPSAYASVEREGANGRKTAYKRGASPATMTAPTLPWIESLTVDTSELDASWTTSANGTAYDAAVLELDWYTDAHLHWKIILPPGLAGFTFPAPPPELAPYLPSATKFGIDRALTFVDLSSTADYDAARALPESRLTDYADAIRQGDEPGGTFSTYDGGEGFAPRHRR